jgi:hypothetical protein
MVDLSQSNMRVTHRSIDIHRLSDKWLPISIAPSDAGLEVGVMTKKGGIHALVFPIHKSGPDWVDAKVNARWSLDFVHDQARR